MDNNTNKEMIFEDISSSSASNKESIVHKAVKTQKKVSRVTKKAANIYGNSAFKNIDKVIKIIAFVVAIAFFLVFLIAAAVIYFFDHGLIFLSVLMLLVGTAVSLIFLFLIYGTGYIISQNKEILKRLTF